MAARRRLIDDPLDLMACSPDSRHELVFSPQTQKDRASLDRDWAFLRPDCQVYFRRLVGDWRLDTSSVW